MQIGKDTRKKSSFTRTVMPIALIATVLVAGAYLLFRDTTAPALTMGPDNSVVTPGTEFTVLAEDAQSGIKSLLIEVDQEGKVRERFEKHFAERTPSHGESLYLNADLYQDGEITITATAADSSLYPFGTPTVLTAKYTLDSTKPALKPSQAQLNLNQGGCGILAYTVSESVQKTGIIVGKDFFPGYKQADNSYLCLFAMPHDIPPAEFKPQLMAVDLAGNQGTTLLRYHANSRKFRRDRINLPLSFLERKGSLFQREFPGDPETDPLGRYIKINTVLRKQNRARLKEIGLESSPSLLVEKSLLRAPGTKTAGFADNRDYYYEGVAVDNQTHLGVDIASIKNAPVEAAAAGTVVLAEFYGIYGNCVIVDHGLGLQTLYSHLNEMAVSKGETVEQKSLLGKTGVTGLAGGDHLHFGVLVSGVPVNPAEWWDPAWVENNILSKL